MIPGALDLNQYNLSELGEKIGAEVKRDYPRVQNSSFLFFLTYYNFPQYLIRVIIKERLTKVNRIQALNDEAKLTICQRISYYQNQYINLFAKLRGWWPLLLPAPFFLYSLFGLILIPILFSPFFIIYQVNPHIFSSPDIRVQSLLILFAITVFVLYYYIIIRIFIELFSLIKKKNFWFIGLYSFTDLIYFVENNADKWTDFKYKCELLESIEYISKLFEFYLPRQIRTGDRNTDDWLKVVSKQFADKLRQKKKWILTPKRDTRDYFINSIAKTFICFAEGNWDALERTSPEELPSVQLRPSFSILLINALKTIIKALVPVVIFITYQLFTQQTPYELTGTGFVSVISILAIYEVSLLISTVDPRFNERVTNVKNIESIISPTKTDTKS